MMKNILMVFTICTKALYNCVSPLIRFVLSTNAVVSVCCSSHLYMEVHFILCMKAEMHLKFRKNINLNCPLFLLLTLFRNM